MQGVDVTKGREANRVRWVTFRAQQQSHEAFERDCVELEFARMPNDEKEQEQEGHVVFHGGQLDRIVTYDEFSVSADGSDQGRGGRPAMTHTNPSLPEAGKPAQKSGKTFTVCQGVTMGGEALPPLVMMKSDAKVPKVPGEFLASLPQIRAQYGFPKERYFDVPFTRNLKGGMNAGAVGLGMFVSLVCDDLSSNLLAHCPSQRLTDCGPSI